MSEDGNAKEKCCCCRGSEQAGGGRTFATGKEERNICIHQDARQRDKRMINNARQKTEERCEQSKMPLDVDERPLREARVLPCSVHWICIFDAGELALLS